MAGLPVFTVAESATAYPLQRRVRGGILSRKSHRASLELRSAAYPASARSATFNRDGPIYFVGTSDPPPEELSTDEQRVRGTPPERDGRCGQMGPSLCSAKNSNQHNLVSDGLSGSAGYVNAVRSIRQLGVPHGCANFVRR